MHLYSWIVNSVTGFCFSKSLSQCARSAHWNETTSWCWTSLMSPSDLLALAGGAETGCHRSSPTSRLGKGYQLKHKILPGNYYQNFTHKSSEVLEQTRVVFNSSFHRLSTAFPTKLEKRPCVSFDPFTSSPISCSFCPLKIPTAMPLHALFSYPRQSIPPLPTYLQA